MNEEMAESTCNVNSSAKKNDKAVRFVDDAQLCVFHSGAIMDIYDAQARDIWYQQNDLAHIKRKAMSISKEAYQHGIGSLLTNTYGKECEETQEALKTWARNAGARRGLERWINDEYAAVRADVRRRTIKSILRAQRKMEEEGTQDFDHSSRVLSRLSEAFSQDSRTFAYLMGRADQHAVEEQFSATCGDQHSKEGDFSVDKATDCGSASDSLRHVRRPKYSSHRLRSPKTVVMSLPQPKRGVNFIASATQDLRHFY